MLQPVQLRSLHAVLTTGSFAEAAARLGFTASAVSQQISALERTTGLVLFERGPRSVRPTAAARALDVRVGALLGQLDGLQREMLAMAAGERGVLRLGSFPTASAGLVPAALALLGRSHPDLEVLLDEEEPNELLPRLLAGSLDLIVVYEYDAVPAFWPRELVRTALVLESFVVLLATKHRLADRESVQLRDLADEIWAASREDAAGSRSLERLCAAAGFAPRIRYRSNDFNVLRGLAGAGLGVALVPALAHLSDPAVRSVPVRFDERQSYRQVTTLHRPDDANPAIPAVIGALSQSARARERNDRRLGIPFLELPDLPGGSRMPGPVPRGK